MSDTTKIQWADATFSPWRGCKKISPGCANCYIYGTTPLRIRGQKSGDDRVRASDATWRNPLKWDSAAQGCGTNPRVFPSLCDWLDDEVTIEWLADFLKLIHDTPNLRWLLLTKRPENFKSRLRAAIPDFQKREVEDYSWVEDWFNGKAPSHVQVGTSVENQPMADQRIPEVLKIPAAMRFLSVEPMLEAISFTTPFQIYAHKGKPCCENKEGYHQLGDGLPSKLRGPRNVGIHWAIFGGESGPGARPCNVEWIRDGVRQCQAAGVPAFVKQLGAFVVDRNDAGFDGDKGEWPMDTHTKELDPSIYQGAPVRVMLHDKKGGDMSEWPEDLRVRQMPKEHK